MITRPKSSFPNRRIGKKLSLDNTNNKLSSNENITFNQSPKISSGKMRSLFNNKKTFSLLDVNEKLINNIGTSLPIQFKRLTQKEIEEIFNFKKLDIHKKKKKLKYNSMKNILYKKLDIPKTIFKDKKNYQTEIKNNTTNNNKKEESNKIIGDKISPLTLEKNDSMSPKHIKMARPQTCKVNRNRINFKKIEFKQKNEEENEKNEKTYRKKDLWKPLNYDNYEELIKNRKLFIKKMQENPFFNRLPQCSIKEIKARINNSDIFFLKKNNEEKKELEKQINDMRQEKYNIYFNSDIFNIKNDEVSINKIGEKYLFNDPNNIKYTSSRESKSDWQNNLNKDATNNFSSEKYNILTPNRKNNYLTKDEIYNLLNNENSVYNNPLHKQKGISKYMDLAINGSSNFGKEYLKIYNSNPNCFKKVVEHCGSYGDLYLQYKNLCDEPFYKKKNSIKY